MNIEITMQEYFEELKLMEEQYGLEEDLYPWIFMLLKMAENRKHDILEGKYKGVSMRDVHNWKSKGINNVTGVKKKILEAFSSEVGGPPEIAIFDKKTECFLGCVEMKRFNDPKWITLQEGKYRITEGIKYDGYKVKYVFGAKEGNKKDNEEKKRVEEQVRNELRMWGIIPVKITKSRFNGNNLHLEMLVYSLNKDFLDIYLKKLHEKDRTEYKEVKISCFEENQLIKHIKRFKKVLYTNGLEFYLLGIDSEKDATSEDDMNIIDIKILANLVNEYEEFKKGADNYSQSLTLKAHSEWNRLIAGLTGIDWHAEPKARIQ